MQESEFKQMITESIEREEKLRGMTNHDFCQLLLDKVWSRYDLFGEESDILTEAARRIAPEITDGVSSKESDIKN